MEDTDYSLTAEDRCDVCYSQAYVHVAMESGHLLFCSHHWNTYKRDLLIKAVSVYDETGRLEAEIRA